MPAASACAVSSPAAASGTCRPPPTTCASYTGSLSAAPDQPRRSTPTATGPSSEPPEARQGRLPALLDRFKRQRPAIQQQTPHSLDIGPGGGNRVSRAHRGAATREEGRPRGQSAQR